MLFYSEKQPSCWNELLMKIQLDDGLFYSIVEVVEWTICPSVKTNFNIKLKEWCSHISKRSLQILNADPQIERERLTSLKEFGKYIIHFIEMWLMYREL